MSSINTRINRLRRAIGGKIAAAALAAIMTGAAGSLLASAATTQTVSGAGSAAATVPINGTISPTTINITVPINASYAIDTTANTFTAPALTVTNNSVAPITVGIQSITADTTGTFTDKLPGDEPWASLSAADSAKYIALGVGITDSAGWTTGYSTTTDWAAAHTAVQMGTLPAGATGSLALAANFGRAFNSTASPIGSIVFSFSLA